MNNLKVFTFKFFIYPLARLHWRIFSPKTVGARALIFYEGQILLVKNLNLPYWTIPGGGLNHGEDPEVCIARELKEELDLKIKAVEYKLGEYTSNQEGKRDLIYVFIIKLLSPEFQKQWELADAKWFALDSLPENISKATLRRIKEHRDGKIEVREVW